MRTHLTPEKELRLASELSDRHDLLKLLAEHSSEAVSRELGIAPLTVRKIDVTDAVWMYPRIDRVTIAEASKRRKIYREAKTLYLKKYSNKALASRYQLSLSGLQRAAARIRTNRQVISA